MKIIAMTLDFAGFSSDGLPDAREKGRYGYAKWKVEETRETNAPIRSKLGYITLLFKKGQDGNKKRENAWKWKAVR